MNQPYKLIRLIFMSQIVTTLETLLLHKSQLLISLGKNWSCLDYNSELYSKCPAANRGVLLTDR